MLIDLNLDLSSHKFCSEWGHKSSNSENLNKNKRVKIKRCVLGRAFNSGYALYRLIPTFPITYGTRHWLLELKFPD